MTTGRTPIPPPLPACSCGCHNAQAANPGKYEEIAAAIGRVVDGKQKAYGNSFNLAGEIFQILYPHGIKPEQYRDVLAIARITDKFFRIATSKKAFGEDPWEDVAGYAILMNRDLLDGEEVKS